MSTTQQIFKNDDMDIHKDIHQQALALKKQGKFNEAIKLFRQIIEQQIDNVELVAEFADALSQSGQYSETFKYTSIALQADNTNKTAMKALAHALYNSSKFKEAISVYEKLIALEPKNTDHYLAASRACQTLGLFDAARQLNKQAIKLSPENTEVLFLSSTLANAEGKMQTALELIENALKIKPGDDNYIGQKARTLFLLNKKQQAYNTIKTRVEKNTLNTSHITLYINLTPEFGNAETAERLINYMLNSKQLGNATLGPFYFSVADLYNRLKNPEKAFHFYQLANKLYPRDFSQQAIEQNYRYITSVFNSQLFKEHKFSNNNNAPIFILGMPRSGTSLTEKIISRHSAVTEMGELPFISNLAKQLITQTEFSVEKSIRLLSENNSLKNFSAQYLTAVNQVKQITTLHFSDKMPENFLFLGLIKRIFPAAKIIHCNRDAADICWSCYTNSFGASGHAYAYDLDSLGYYYNYYLKIMQHWKELFPDGYYELSYEALVENPEHETRKLLEYCGLEWEDACLEHHKSTSYMHTASYEQVRQPIYTTSKQKWKAYETYLKPLFEALEKYRDIFRDS